MLTLALMLKLSYFRFTLPIVLLLPLTIMFKLPSMLIWVMLALRAILMLYVTSALGFLRLGYHIAKSVIDNTNDMLSLLIPCRCKPTAELSGELLIQSI